MASIGVPAAILPNTETSVDLFSFLSNPPLITLGVNVLNISFALAFSGNFTTSNALASVSYTHLRAHET